MTNTKAPANAQVKRAATTTVCPQAAIQIALDTQYLIGEGGQFPTSGIYMFDNELGNGSTGEGTMELSTQLPAGTLISWNVFPLNPNTGDTAAITGFNVSQGNVFGSSGFPRQVTPSFWVGEAVNDGSQTYQIQVTISSALGPLYVVSWDPFITATGA